MQVQRNLKWMVFLFIILTTFKSGHAKETQPILEKLDQLLKTALEWRANQQMQLQSQDSKLKPTVSVTISGALCFVAASISSAGGIGGGGLFIPILSIVAGLDLKTASSFSAFMVTGGSIANVACNMIIKGKKNGGKTLIDYDIALLSEPCMLLGVSIGVICNLMLPEWLITIMFACFLAWSTFKTFKSGISYWKLESEWMSKNRCQKLEGGMLIAEKSGETVQSSQEPLLQKETSLKLDIPWTKLGMLVAIWFCFFVLYLLRGNRYGQGIIVMQTCGVGYWIISSTQIPLCIIFTLWILYSRKSNTDQFQQQELGSDAKNQGPNMFVFPIMALLAGGLGGVFGVGGGMLISPLLLQVGITPEVTAATCSFMVFFSSTMSAFQYLLLGMDHVYAAIIYAIICFIASIIGLVIVQSAIAKQGRASLIVFSVGIVMAVSTILMSSFGAVDVWRDYITGKYMGFKKPC
ncbi:sulfite exporter TauE/SafE family protein 2 [Coffea arabica]|uniref:Sulfite exporter TauE/SafE family protein 2 n=1 Tax=Coffea arabica TaxID=13443 RepID=A0A6P6VPW3_COFAR|nr:sulfite exporter TauE/SafE family protein 2-like [Coffea arabica]